jgi:hypothetical protein
MRMKVGRGRARRRARARGGSLELEGVADMHLLLLICTSGLVATPAIYSICVKFYGRLQEHDAVKADTHSPYSVLQPVHARPMSSKSWAGEMQKNCLLDL